MTRIDGTASNVTEVEPERLGGVGRGRQRRGSPDLEAYKRRIERINDTELDDDEAVLRRFEPRE